MFLLYKIFTIFFFPFFLLIIYLRKFLGKEDNIRFKEKIFTSHFKPISVGKNTLIWFHCASIGEIMSIIPIIDEIKKNNNKIKILITTVTLSSGKIIEKKFSYNSNIVHRYFPLDAPHLVKKFVNIWNPNLVAFVDSEIWPNFINEIKKRKIPLALINGRITKKTFDRWKIFDSFSKKIFSSFDVCFASSKESEKNLKNLKAKNVKYFGNLKFIPSKNIAPKLESSNKLFLDKHKVWCAASTHEKEEIFCIKTHIEIKKFHNNILTIIIPRHINRIKNIYLECKKFNLKTQILNDKDAIKENTEIILVNSFGFLTMYYDYCKSVFIGKSLIKKLSLVGGQNPIEAAKLGCKIYHGRYVYNFQEVYNFLKINNISEEIHNIEELSSKIIHDLKKPKMINMENIKKINFHGIEILEKTIKEINKMIS